MSPADPRSPGQAVLRAAVDALDATVKVAMDARAALKAALGEGEEGAIIDLEDRHRWLTIKQAAGVARCSEKTIERRLHEVGVKVNGRRYVDRNKLMADRTR